MTPSKLESRSGDKAAKEWLFDRRRTLDFTKLRQEFVAEVLKSIRQQTDLDSAIDVGCGVGDFSKFLLDLGLRVVGVDGREENVSEARRRYPGIKFLAGNAEDLPVAQIGGSDLTFCFGLLYHLENPFRAVRNLCNLTHKVLLIETMCVPSTSASMELLDEGFGEDQGLNYVAFYPSESCLVKMLYRAGFRFVYHCRPLPADDLYTGTFWRKRLRTVLVASKIPLDSPSLILANDDIRPVPGVLDPWTTGPSRLLYRLRCSASQLVTPIRRLFR